MKKLKLAAREINSVLIEPIALLLVVGVIFAIAALPVILLVRILL